MQLKICLNHGTHILQQLEIKRNLRKHKVHAVTVDAQNNMELTSKDLTLAVFLLYDLNKSLNVQIRLHLSYKFTHSRSYYGISVKDMNY